MLCLSMGEGVVLYCIVLFFVCILGHVWIGGIEKPSNNDIAIHISFYEFERLLMYDLFSVKFLKVL